MADTGVVTVTSARRAWVLPLVLSTMTSQALLVVLAPTMPAIGAELHASVPSVGQARTVTAAVAVTASLVLTARIGVIGVPRLLRSGSVLTVLAAGSVAAVPAAPGPMPLRALTRDRYARRWMLAELLAYTCWTALRTFVGAYFVERLGVGESLAGWLLAAGAAAYFVAATRSAGLAARFSRRHLAAVGAVVMGGLAAGLLGFEAGVAASAVLFCLIGVVAGARTPASSGLGLEQLPRHGGSMMAVRTAVTQLGYLLGAVIGGTVIALAGYPALGLVLAAGMAASALLILRVREA